MFYQTFTLISSFYGQVRRRQRMGGLRGTSRAGRKCSSSLGTQKWKWAGRGAGTTERNREDEI
jgi:hypothetical protein